MATALVTHGRHWSTYYFISLGVTSFNFCFAYWAFRKYEQDLFRPLLSSTLQRTVSRPNPPAARAESEVSRIAILKLALKNKTTLLGAAFIFAYQGAEVSISGWVISFLLSYRHSPASSTGYVTAGFWAGITIGRFVLSHPAHRVGEKLAVICLTMGAVAFQLLVWFVPNFIGDAVSVATLGLLLGPVYPCATVIFSKLLDRRIQMSSLSFISAVGSSGGAAAPFFTGLLAQVTGTWVLHPICIALFGVMLVSWVVLPKVPGKRRE